MTAGVDKEIRVYISAAQCGVAAVVRSGSGAILRAEAEALKTRAREPGQWWHSPAWSRHRDVGAMLMDSEPDMLLYAQLLVQLAAYL